MSTPSTTESAVAAKAWSPQEATMVRVYLKESDHGLKPLLDCLHDELGVRGATVTRGVAGFGSSGVVHSTRLVDLSTDLPLVLEFFDRPDRARAAIERISDFVEPGHVVAWTVYVDGNGANRPDA